jgi:hypothetical protein
MPMRTSYAPEWISVNEQLPEAVQDGMSEGVLFSIKDGGGPVISFVGGASFGHRQHCWCADDGSAIDEHPGSITDWAEMPKGPKP